MGKRYSKGDQGIRILPGQWRPHCPYEHIVWVSPPWESEDYIWLDFPEAVLFEGDMIYLSHDNPLFPSKFPDIGPVPWGKGENEVSFERTLPDGTGFASRVSLKDENSALLEIRIFNSSDYELKDIKLQTCAFMRAINEFSLNTMENKYVHVPGKGWINFFEAAESEEENGTFRLGWRAGAKIADFPVIATLSREGNHITAMTWYDDTYSLIGNQAHPCMHADPFFENIAPGEERTVTGELIFFDGGLEGFDSFMKHKLEEHKNTKQ